MGKINKKWKNDGDEDKFLKKLLKEGKFSKDTKPGAIKKDYPNIFGDFSLGVVRNHCNEFKRANGLYLSDFAEYKCSDDDDEENDDNNDSIASKDCESISRSNIIAHINFPVVCEQYKNPVNQMDMVFLAINMPSGAQNVKIDLNRDGTVVIKKYNWTKLMYDIDDLFKKQLDTAEIESYHPKIVAFKNGLEKARTKIDMAPQSLIEIKLPIRVQTSMTSWTKKGILRADGSQVLTADFCGYVKEYNKSLADASVTFEM